MQPAQNPVPTSTITPKSNPSKHVVQYSLSVYGLWSRSVCSYALATLCPVLRYRIGLPASPTPTLAGCGSCTTLR
eukprot:3291650-Rhodomonas_salina.1